MIRPAHPQMSERRACRLAGLGRASYRYGRRKSEEAGLRKRLQELGAAMAGVVQQAAQAALIIASSDMNHYESDAVTRVKDRKAIDQILAMDPEGLFEVVRRENISMCGYGPTVAMLTAAAILGATSAELVKYATSGDVSMDFDHVVGYAGIIIS